MDYTAYTNRLRAAIHRILVNRIYSKYPSASAFARELNVSRQHIAFVMNKQRVASVGLRPLLVLARHTGSSLSELIKEAETMLENDDENVDG